MKITLNIPKEKQDFFMQPTLTDTIQEAVRVILKDYLHCQTNYDLPKIKSTMKKGRN